MFGRRFKFPIPAILPTKCDNCGARLRWTPVTHMDPVIGIEKVDHYKAECACGEVHYRDGRGQVVEPATENLAPDKSEFARSPQGEVPYSGYMEALKIEREKEEAFKKAQAAKAAAAGGAAPPAGEGAPAGGGAPAADDSPKPEGAPATEEAPAEA